MKQHQSYHLRFAFLNAAISAGKGIPKWCSACSKTDLFSAICWIVGAKLHLEGCIAPHNVLMEQRRTASLWNAVSPRQAAALDNSLRLCPEPIWPSHACSCRSVCGSCCVERVCHLQSMASGVVKGSTQLQRQCAHAALPPCTPAPINSRPAQQLLVGIKISATSDTHLALQESSSSPLIWCDALCAWLTYVWRDTTDQAVLT